MFRELMNFSYRRSAFQAFGWYLTFLFIGVIISGIAASLLIRATSFADGLQKGAAIAPLIMVPYHIVLGVALLWSRWKSVLSVFLALGALALSILLGALGGLLLLAVLTTRPSQKSRKEIGQVFE